MSETLPAPLPPKPLSRWPLVLIALDKLVKAVGLVIVSFVLRALLSPESHLAVENWINNNRLEPHNFVIHYFFDLAEKSMGIQPNTLRHLRLGIIIYAGLYLVEGIGLLADWMWAEWLVVISTAIFLPVEIYEIARELTLGRCLLFLINILVLWYLCYRLKRRRTVEHAKAKALTQPAFPAVTDSPAAASKPGTAPPSPPAAGLSSDSPR